MTAFSSIITIVTLPLIVQFALQKYQSAEQAISLDIPQVIIQLFVIIIIPVIIGMLIRKRSPNFADKMGKASQNCVSDHFGTGHRWDLP